MTAQQLKNSILLLAVQGKLVPQDPNDEPASVLLERITKERERLIKEKKIKKPKTTSRIFRRDGHYYESVNGGEPACIDEQIPFDIPESWEWVRFGTIFALLNGDRGKNYPAKSKLQQQGKIPFISAVNIQNGTISKDGLLYLEESQYNKLNAGKLKLNDWVICIRGSLGKCCVYPFNIGAIASSLVIARPHLTIASEYMNAFMGTVFHILLNKYANGAVLPNLSANDLGQFLFPLPPSQEQDKIALKLAKIEPFIEKYREKETFISTLNHDFPSALKKSILQHAIQGKLVPQDPNDEPASVLLERIAKERAKTGKKAAKSMSRIERRDRGTYEIFPDGSEKDISGEIPFEIPNSWEWCRLCNILFSFSTGPFGSMVHKSDYIDTPNGIPLINPTNIKNGSIRAEGIQKVSIEKAAILENYKVRKGDIILARRGDLSKCAIVTETENLWLCGTGAFFMRLLFLDNEYFCLLYSSSHTQSVLHSESVGTTMINLNQKLLNNLLIPVPPIQEQHRIVEKLGVLMKEIGATK